jgi:nucleoside-diphosphate-sugar epimerase
LIDGPLLVTGGTGFIGRHVLRTLRGRCPVRLLVHDRAPDPGEATGLEQVRADLADPASLADACRGVERVVHLASHIGDDESRCERVNARGTEALVHRARAAGVRRFLYLSNVAVYGYAVHRGADEATAVAAPATPISRSRVAAERAVLAAGGTVIRPLFVYGEGDTRFLPAIGRALQRLPFLIDDGRARLSVIAVTDLARCITALALGQPDPAGVFHATDEQPVHFREIVDLVAPLIGKAAPRLSVPYSLGRHLVRLARLGRGWTASDAHRLFLVSHDHFYDSRRLWKTSGLPLPAPMTAQFGDCLAWYHAVMKKEWAA